MCDQIEKMGKGFILGDTEDRHCTHLVLWKDMCQPKALGGVGIWNMRICNKAYLMKLM